MRLPPTRDQGGSRSGGKRTPQCFTTRKTHQYAPDWLATTRTRTIMRPVELAILVPYSQELNRMNSVVLVTGATGLVGNNVVRQLLAQGRRVRVLIRGQREDRAFAGLDLEFAS